MEFAKSARSLMTFIILFFFSFTAKSCYLLYQPETDCNANRERIVLVLLCYSDAFVNQLAIRVLPILLYIYQIYDLTRHIFFSSL